MASRCAANRPPFDVAASDFRTSWPELRRSKRRPKPSISAGNCCSAMGKKWPILASSPRRGGFKKQPAMQLKRQRGATENENRCTIDGARRQRREESRKAFEKPAGVVFSFFRAAPVWSFLREFFDNPPFPRGPRPLRATQSSAALDRKRRPMRSRRLARRDDAFEHYR